ncbi:hypothetical protein CMUS01_11700 [Colletotrichum musicola]|uniref:Uncharacterized protein n=1 Tax=Colletotrichum musicola TaxID=2175873 RepID=A0A8H6N452_9PEZI|nr:hypothetical protein CMUS01_11700 [Colletotrichum musicola]
MHHTSPGGVTAGFRVDGPHPGPGIAGPIRPKVRIPVSQLSIGDYDARKGDRVTVEDVRDRCPAGRRAKLLSRVAIADVGPLPTHAPFLLQAAAMLLIPAKAEANS